MPPEIVTAEMLEKMTPAERHEHFLSSIIWNLDDLPPELEPLLERARARTLQRIKETESQA